jgi:DNA-binding GntR family transcriptional regulator
MFGALPLADRVNSLQGQQGLHPEAQETQRVSAGAPSGLGPIFGTLYTEYIDAMALRLDPLQPTPDLAERTYRTLLDAIGAGTLRPGARITQDELAERLSVSRQPVLQALKLLKKDGFVRDAPGRGLIVAPIEPAWVAEVYELRGALEALAAQLAARRRHTVDAALIERGRRLAAGRNVQAMIDADLAFHEALYAAGGNGLLRETAQTHWHHLRRVVSVALEDGAGMRAAVWDEHEAIAAAIAAGDEDLAQRLARAHCQNAAAQISARLPAP